MISAFEIYLVMQLDKLCKFFDMVCVISLCTLTISVIVWVICEDTIFSDYWCDATSEDTAKNKLLRGILYKVGKWSLCVACSALILGSFIPSTKTAAAIFIIPKIVNNETIQKEAGEIYILAKQALKQSIVGETDKSKDTISDEKKD